MKPMWTLEQLEDYAKSQAQQTVYGIFQRTQNAKSHEEIADVIEDELFKKMRHAMKEAYFKGVRDAGLEYERRSDVAQFREAIKDIYEGLKDI